MVQIQMSANNKTTIYKLYIVVFYILTIYYSLIQIILSFLTVLYFYG